MARNRMIRGLIGLMALLTLGACQQVPVEMEEPMAVPTTAEYRLGPGDQLRVRVYGEEELSGEYAVDSGGLVAMPLIGDVEAGSKTAREFAQEVEARLADGYVLEPNVSVDVIGYRPFYVMGGVNAPGQYPYAPGMTAMTAIALAGGYTEDGIEDYVLVVRGSDPQKIERRAPLSTPIMPDDVVRVPETQVF